MLSEELLSEIKDDFIEYVYSDTEIRLLESEVHMKQNNGRLSVKFNENELISISEDDLEDNDTDDIALKLFEKIGNVKELLVKIKIDELTEYIDTAVKAVKDLLKENFDEDAAEDMTIEVKDVGYETYHWMTDVESESGYPIIALTVTDYDEFDFAYPLNIYYPKNSYDIEELRDNLEKYIEDKGN